MIAEALFLLRRGGVFPDRLLEMIRRGILMPDFSLAGEIEPILHLMRKYRDIPLSLADACLVRMAEIHPASVVMTLDSDFTIYRKSRRGTIPLLIPGR